MDLNRILREGFIAAASAQQSSPSGSRRGYDQRQPLFTPAMLGSAVFWGAHDPTAVVIEPARIFAYTMIHVSAFVVVGCIAAALAAEVEYAPSTLFLVVVGFCFFEVGFYILIALIAKPLLANLVWWNVAVGNGLAALGMGYYLWREHPRIGEELRRAPIGRPKTAKQRGTRKLERE
jgi:hypothetical protein